MTNAINFANTFKRAENESIDDYVTRTNTGIEVSKVIPQYEFNGETRTAVGHALIVANNENWANPEILGAVGSENAKRASGFWEPVQPRNIITRFEEAAQNMGGAVDLLTFHNGVVRGNITLDEKEMPAVGKRKLGEVYKRGLSFEVGCNGKVGIGARAQLLRCICDNQMVSNTNAFSVSFRHNAQELELKADKLVELTSTIDQYFDHQSQVMNALANIKVNDAQAMLILAASLGNRNLQESIWAYHSAPGAQAGSMKGVFEAVTYMGSHTLADKRSNSARGSVNAAIAATLDGSDNAKWLNTFEKWAKNPELFKDWTAKAAKGKSSPRDMVIEGEAVAVEA